MDIQISSNFERYLFALAEMNSGCVKQWMNDLSDYGGFSISKNLLARAKLDFDSACTEDGATLECIHRTHKDHGYLLDPHSAVGFSAAQHLNLEGPVIVLACAHPAKFRNAMEAATGASRNPPEQFAALENLPTRVQRIQASVSSVQNYLESCPLPQA